MTPETTDAVAPKAEATAPGSASALRYRRFLAAFTPALLTLGLPPSDSDHRRVLAVVRYLQS